ncbi:MAG: carboxypeptidase-like regulatory domain-containing protein [Sphingobacteriales bacterium]
MKKIILSCLLSIFALLASAQNGSFTQTVRGTVIDDQSGNVLRTVTVTLDNVKPAISGITDSLGNFKLQNVPIGRQTIIVSLVGYKEAVMQNIEVTSSKEVIVEIRMTENIKVLNEVVVKGGKQKDKAINELAVVSARQLSIDEAVRYSGTRNDPSRMAQNFAGVSGNNDARNDIVIRGNSPTGVLWRMDGIDIPSPNHFSTLGATGGPVTILNTNTLKNSDFITSAFPAQYGNAVAGVFDLRMRNGNNEKNEYLAQMGFNGFEFGAEGPLNKDTKSSFLIDYRYSMVAAIEALGLNVGTGNATPYYQDVNFKLHIVTKKSGTFDWFGLGGESHITLPPDSTNNLYVSNNGFLSNQKFSSLTGVTGVTNTYFFNPNTSGKISFAISGFQSKFNQQIIRPNLPDKTENDINTRQSQVSAGYTFNKKFSPKNQLTTGLVSEIYLLNLRQDYIPDGDTVLKTLINTKNSAALFKGFVNLNHRFTDALSSNFGLYSQWFSLNGSWSVEPRWNLNYQFKENQSFSFGAGLHSQLQPLEVYFYQTQNTAGQTQLTNKNLDFVKSIHTVAGYDINFTSHLRLKTELYGQYIYNAAVETSPSSFSMLNSGATFGFPDKSYLLNNGKGYNYGLEVTLEKFLNQGFYYLFTGSVFQSKYMGSDNIWRSTAFNSNYVANLLTGKEFKLNKKSSFAIDTKLAVAGGQRYTPFDVSASRAAGYVVYKSNEAYSLQNSAYARWDLKFSYIHNGKKMTEKWFVDLQNITNRQNLYVRTLNPMTGHVGEINQIGFFPNFNYVVTF